MNILLVYALIVFIIGSCLGSFFKLVVDRYNTNESFVFKPSYCTSCKNNLLWWQNIPILSYLLLAGKCFFCKTKIDIGCFLSELTTATLALILFISAYSKKSNIFEITLLLFFFMTIVLLSMLDLKHRTIPHLITYSAIIFIITSKFLLTGALNNSLFNLGIAFLFMDILYLIFTLIKRFELDNNLISIPLMAWAVYYSFYNNIYFVVIFIVVYFCIFNLKINSRLLITSWLILSFALLFLVYKIIFIDFAPEKLKLFFIGVGAIYLICEIVFYFFNSFLPVKEISTPSSTTVLGGGDITVFALISVYLGFKGALLTLLIASLLAIISHFIIGNFRGQLKTNYIPFIPYLGLACFIIIITFSNV